MDLAVFYVLMSHLAHVDRQAALRLQPPGASETGPPAQELFGSRHTSQQTLGSTGRAAVASPSSQPRPGLLGFPFAASAESPATNSLASRRQQSVAPGTAAYSEEIQSATEVPLWTASAAVQAEASATNNYVNPLLHDCFSTQAGPSSANNDLCQANLHDCNSTKKGQISASKDVPSGGSQDNSADQTEQSTGSSNQELLRPRSPISGVAGSEPLPVTGSCTCTCNIMMTCVCHGTCTCTCTCTCQCTKCQFDTCTCKCSLRCAGAWTCASCKYRHELADESFKLKSCQLCGERRSCARRPELATPVLTAAYFEESHSATEVPLRTASGSAVHPALLYSRGSSQRAEPPHHFWHAPLSLSFRLPAHQRQWIEDLQPQLRTLTEQWLAAGVSLPTALDQAMKCHELESFRSCVAEAIVSGNIGQWRAFRNQRHYPCGQFLSPAASAEALDRIAEGLFRRLALEPLVNDINCHNFDLCWLSATVASDPSSMVWSLEPFLRSDVENIFPDRSFPPAFVRPAPFAASDLDVTNALPRDFMWEAARDWPFSLQASQPSFEYRGEARFPEQGDPGGLFASGPIPPPQARPALHPLLPLSAGHWPLSGPLSRLFVVPSGHSLPGLLEIPGDSRLVSMFRRAAGLVPGLPASAIESAAQTQPRVEDFDPSIIAAAAFAKHHASAENVRLLPWPSSLFKWIAAAFDTAASEAVRKSLHNAIIEILFADGIRNKWEIIRWSASPLPWACVSWERVPLVPGEENWDAGTVDSQPAVSDMQVPSVAISLKRNVSAASPDADDEPAPEFFRAAENARNSVSVETASELIETVPDLDDKFLPAFPADPVSDSLSKRLKQSGGSPRTYGPAGSPSVWYLPDLFEAENADLSESDGNTILFPQHGPSFNAAGVPRNPAEEANLHASSATAWSTPVPAHLWAAQPPPDPEPRTWASDPVNRAFLWKQTAPDVSLGPSSSPLLPPSFASALARDGHGILVAIKGATGCQSNATLAAVRQFELLAASTTNHPVSDQRAQTHWADDCRLMVGVEAFRWDNFLSEFFGPGYVVVLITEKRALELPSIVSAVGLLKANGSSPAYVECVVYLPDKFDLFESGRHSDVWDSQRAIDYFDAIVAVVNVHQLSQDLLDRLDSPARALARVPRASPENLTQAFKESGPALLAFSASRRLVGASGDWAVRGVFYDDFISTGFRIFMPHVLDSEAHVAKLCGVDLADGDTYWKSNTPKKNKNESATETQELVILGLTIPAADGIGKLSYGDHKRSRVEDLGLNILAEAVDRGSAAASRASASNRARTSRSQARVRGPELLSWLGKVGDLANADPFLATTLSGVYSILPPMFGDLPEFDLSLSAQEMLLDVCVAVRDGQGRAALPAFSLPDPADGTTWITLCDASRRLIPLASGEKWKVGAGGWIFNPATRIVIWFAFGWRHDEVKLIDISNLEGKCQEICLAIIRIISPSAVRIRTNRLVRQEITYIHQLGDNQSESEHLQNSFRGKAASARRSVTRRSAIMRSMPNARVLSDHVLRQNNSESDAMADNESAEALRLIRLRCAPAAGNVHFVEFPASNIPNAVRDTSDIRAIIKAAVAGKSASGVHAEHKWSSGVKSRTETFVEHRDILRDLRLPAHHGFAEFAAGFESASASLSSKFSLPASSRWPGIWQDMPLDASLTDDDRQRCAVTAVAVWDVYAPTAVLRAPRRSQLPASDRVSASFPFVSAPKPAVGRRGNPNRYVPAPPPEAMGAPDAKLAQSPVTGPSDRSFSGLIDYVGAYLRGLDDKLLAKRDDAVEAAGLPRLLRPPYMYPPPPPGGFLSADLAVEYMANLRQYWLQRFRDYSAQAVQACKTGPNPMSLNRLLPMGKDLDFCDDWLVAYDAEWIRSTAAGDDFNLDVLPDNGFVDRTVIIRAARIDDWGLSWDTATSYDADSNVMHRSRRVLPIPWADPQLFTELDFAQILAIVTRDWFNGIVSPDVDIILEHIFLGFDVRSTVERAIVLVANTPDFFSNRDFVEKKTEEKMSKFVTPRLSPGVRGLAIVPCFLLSNNVVLDQLDGATGEVKPRLTCNPSGPVPPWSKEFLRAGRSRASRNSPAPAWSDFGSFDPTVNGNHTRKVHFDYMKLSDIAHQSAIFLAARHTVLQPDQSSESLAVSQAKADMSSYYEALSRGTHFWHYNLNFVSPRGMQLNSRACFGFSAEPDTSNRWAFVLCDLMNRDLAQEQAAWERVFRFARDGKL